MDRQQPSIFVSGGTGYLGRSMIAGLLGRGHTVRALVRRGSEGKLPAGCEAVLGDPLSAGSFKGHGNDLMATILAGAVN